MYGNPINQYVDRDCKCDWCKCAKCKRSIVSHDGRKACKCDRAAEGYMSLGRAKELRGEPINENSS